MSSHPSLASSVLDGGRGRTKAQSNSSLHVPQHLKKSHSKGKVHSRSLSHTKLMNKVSAPGGTSGVLSRPNLGRSKSTDMLLRTNSRGGAKRSNRSFTKLSGLQPLLKTTSNQSLKLNKSSGSLKGLFGASVTGAATAGLRTSGRKGKAIMRLNDDDPDSQEYEDMKNDEESNTSLEPEQNDRNLADDIAESPENRLSSGKEVPSSSEIESYENNDNDLQIMNAPNKDQTFMGLDNRTSPSQDPQKGKKVVQGELIGKNSAQTESSIDETQNMYGGSFLLSQSTGLTKKLDKGKGGNSRSKNDVYNGNGIVVPHSENIGGPNNSESLTGISFKAKPIDNVAEPVVTNKTVNQNNSYQPNQTIFSNLQRTNSQYLSSKKHPKQLKNYQKHFGLGPDDIDSNTTNFSNFLNKQHSFQSENNMDTRTQQRLWLQRESSLMDIPSEGHIPNLSTLSLSNMMFPSSYSQSSASNRDTSQNMLAMTPAPQHSTTNEAFTGGPENGSLTNINGLFMMIQNHQNSIQSRTEYERLNREYLNVRRHLNPVGECLSRLEKKSRSKNEIDVLKSRLSSKSPLLSLSTRDKNNNSFNEFSPLFQDKKDEIVPTLNSIWQDALVSSLSVTPSPTSQMSPAIQGLSWNNQRPINPRGSSYNNLRSSQTPTTRAVKLAAAHAASLSNHRPNEQLVNIN
ncbi:uncharacterized protein PRCAT00003423001 [Priceomyces carsonii]|uniref:uncharacterized protein n=1 Tax=Priceomyces carsonii TaxID=28549 RepID=UPI002ED79139|nr:unnamed protein product [Priceomyces carsonii]